VLDLYVDGDACPVKEEVYRVARRHDIKVYVVTHGSLRVPDRGRVERVRVPRGFDAADDWIAAHVAADDVAITADIPLAARCLAQGARVLAPDGVPFTEESIGNALAQRELMEQLRAMGTVTGGPAPFTAADRSRFLRTLEETVQAILRASANRA
jgi:uncharacterized protein YaiI (UPF0178 family)